MNRYSGQIADSTEMEILTSGSRQEIYNLERYIVSIDPGPWNNESGLVR
jgi:hypothetical protein